MSRDERTITGSQWRIVFRRRGDRYVHTLENFVARAWTPRLESLEGTSDEAWPASPPLQEVHVEERTGGKRVIFGVGMAGNSHWSLSAAVDPATDDFTFDVACRCKSLPTSIGSQYRLFPGSVECDSEQSAPSLVDKIAIKAAPEYAALEAIFGSERLVLRPRLEKPDWPQTIRWQYQWRFAE